MPEERGINNSISEEIMKKAFKLVFDVISGIFRDNIGEYSAQAAFFMTISFIPLIMLTISIIKFLPITENELFAQAVAVFPDGAKEFVALFLREAYGKSGATVISITAVSTLWSASIGVFAINKGLNRIYCADETRNYLFVRIASMIYTLLLLVLIALCLAVFVFGETITKSIETHIPKIFKAALVVLGLRRFIGIAVLGAFFLLLYTFVPNRKTRIILEIPGALLSAAGWMIFSSIFSYYYENISNYSYLYGSLSTVVFFMLWLFFCMYILFIGAELNKCIEDRTERRHLFGN